MADRNDETWLFVVEWFDPLPQLKKTYLLKYFVDQHMLEMVDVKTKKLFLKKSNCPKELTLNDFYVGGKIMAYGRELDIVDYGDGKTRDKLHHQLQVVALILSSKLYLSWGEIIDNFQSTFNLTKLKTFLLSSTIEDNLTNILALRSRKSVDIFSEGVNLVICGHAEDGFNKLNDLIKELNISNKILMTTSNQQTNDLQDLLFNKTKFVVPSTATMDNCSCAIIKPHSVKSYLVGKIIQQIINQGYEVSAMTSINFDKVQAEEFLEVYKGVVPEYSDHINQLSSGLCIALEVRAENAVETFRWTAGPWDAGMAKELYPDTIRGKYAIDNVRNAIHCTDLAQDAVLECEYVFNILE